ncbi:hypothetical protein [Pedobacter sp. JY14-1]|uniref:hypothetical protein n=1 Tax=Pedobacter sp. JY14-1 TaxID=3034151 RepID=UPI0023E252EE|nr:hypothetical protein [Pedobacter sp. JY14-1]
MNNPSFEIYVNNHLVSTAGITSEFGVVSVITQWVNSNVDSHKYLSINVSGLDSTTETYLTWCDRELIIGDEVTIKVTDGKNISTPIAKPKMSEKDLLASKISYFHKLKEELKDHL